MNNNIIIPEPIVFDWDKGNKDKNIKKHGIINEDAESVFLDSISLLAEDLKHSKFEDRFQIIGKSEHNNLLSIFFTIRKEKIRIISARKMNTKEKNIYESQKT